MKRAGWSFEFKRRLAAGTGTIREIAAQPVKPDMVRTSSLNAIHDNPKIVFKEEHRPAVNAFSGISLVAVVLTRAHRPIVCVLKLQEFRSGSIDELKAPGVHH